MPPFLKVFRFSSAPASVRIGLSYLVLASLWIWGSDWLTLQWLADSAALTRAQSWKGGFFVLFTAALLFVLVRREERVAAAIQQQLLAEQRRWRFAVDGSDLGLWDWDLTTGSVFFSPRWKTMLGYAEADIGHQLSEWESRIHPDDKARAMADLERHLRGGSDFYVSEHRVRCKDGSYKWILDRGQVVERNEQGQALRMIGTHTDLTTLKQRELAEITIAHLTRHDSLTGLPNRVLLRDRIEAALAHARREPEPLALMFIDIDRFKFINDSLGHRAGDALLVEIASRLRQAVRQQDTVSRMGGDEFTLLLPQTDAEGAAHLAQVLIERISAPSLIEGMELIVTPSIGIAIFPGDGQDVDALLQAGDTAMYRAKTAGGADFQFYEPGMHQNASRMLQLENALRWALERDELELHYQPKIGLRTRQVAGCEALLRWRHPELGLVAPDEFIPIAEACGLILPIGEWVLRTALAQHKTWQNAGLAPSVVAVNVSAIQFRQAQFPEFVRSVLAELGLEPAALELELTESVVSADPEEAIRIMEQLDRLGVQLSVDDFGTGYSALSYLKRFPIHKLKIDQSFVRDLGRDSASALIVAGVIAMARSLGLRTIAEGVESAAQVDWLRSAGCDEVQGYRYASPLPAGQYEGWLRNYLPDLRN
jgi:diguanylate cyclase (GGDEF)-like protein/PAS domain S-box-containing protein